MALLTIFLLSVLLACTLFFIALSFRYDLTCRAVVFKIFSRLGIPLGAYLPAEFSTPYQRLMRENEAWHRPVLLNLATSDGSGQVTHPDVAYIPEGFGQGKWTYWMACTPYPQRNAQYENPELFVSFDGIDWAVPFGFKNPLVPSPAIAGDHHSDPDILFCLDQLWLFYRQTIRSRTPNENRLFLIKSADGVRWSVPIEVLCDKTGRELLSPAVIHDGHQFLMWTVEICEEQFLIVRRSSPNGVAWSAPEVCRLAGLEMPRHAWHIDVMQESERLSAVLVSCIGNGGVKSRIHYAYSEDHGLRWSTAGFLFDQAYEFEAEVQYRGSLLGRDGHPGVYDLWYSAASSKFLFSIAHLSLIRDHNRMLPCQLRLESAHAKRAKVSLELEK
jgi:hypothetical protein